MENKKIADRKILSQLFLTFFRIGAFTFGGGYAMIPLIQREVADEKQWISREDILDVVAIAESTPGPIAINAATFIGRKVGGVRGAALATLGVVLPSFVIIVLISLALQQFQQLRAVRYAFFGIRAGVLALLVKALVSMYRQCPKSLTAYLLMAAAFAGAALLKISAPVVIACCAVLGLGVYWLAGKEKNS